MSETPRLSFKIEGLIVGLWTGICCGVLLVSLLLIVSQTKLAENSTSETKEKFLIALVGAGGAITGAIAGGICTGCGGFYASKYVQ